jgi:hypothetical protein
MSCHLGELGQVMSSPVVAERIFHDSKSGKPVVARIFAARQIDQSEWSCRIEVEGLDDRFQRDVIGIDSLQALYLALRGLVAHLEKHEHRLAFLDGRPGDCGLPLVIPWDLGASGKAGKADIYRYIRNKLSEVTGGASPSQ